MRPSLKYHIQVLLIFIITDCFTQNSLFTVIHKDSLTFTQDEQDYIDHISDIPDICDSTSIRYVKIEDVLNLQDNGILQFEIPGMEGDTFNTYALDVLYRDSNDYVWSGEIPDSGGNLVIVRHPKGFGGLINYTDNYYTIYHLRQ